MLARHEQQLHALRQPLLFEKAFIPAESGYGERLTRANDQVFLQLGVSLLSSGHCHTNSINFLLPPDSGVRKTYQVTSLLEINRLASLNLANI